MKHNAKNLTSMGVLTALAIVLEILPSPPGGLTKFVGLPILVGGLALGPGRGFIIGCVSDVIGYAISPTGTFFPGFTITQGLTGAIPGMIAYRRPPGFVTYLCAIGVGQTVTSVIAVPLMLSYLTGLPTLPFLVRAAIAQTLHVPLYAVLCVTIIRSLMASGLTHQKEPAKQ